MSFTALPSDFPFDRPPDHVNKKGVAWWLDTATTRVAVIGGLKGYTVWHVVQGPAYSRVVLSRDRVILFAHHQWNVVMDFVTALVAATGESKKKE